MENVTLLSIIGYILIGCSLCLLVFVIKPKPLKRWQKRSGIEGVVGSLLWGLIVGLFWGLVGFVLDFLGGNLTGYLVVGLVMGLFWGFILGFIKALSRF